MEPEFIELMQTFQKTGTRLTTLNQTIIGFKEILNKLRFDLDAMVELVELEGIVDLANQSTKALTTFNTTFLEINQTHERLLDLEQTTINYRELVAKIETQLEVSVHDQLAKVESTVKRQIDQLRKQMMEESAPQFLSGELSQFALVSGHYLYYKNPNQPKMLSIRSLLTDEIINVEEMQVEKIQQVNHQIFVLNEMDRCLYLIDKQSKNLVCENVTFNFIIKGFELYELVDHQLIKRHLLTKQQSVVAEDVRQFDISQDVLIYEQHNQIHYLKIQ
ncbi:MAG: hypothetical protein ACRCST_07875 [Turicibacter sp.]